MYFSELKKQLTTQNRRTFLLMLGKLGIFSLIGWRLFNIQISQSEKYKTLSKNNQINIEILLPTRGEILDRNNIVLASNINKYDIFLIPEQTVDVNESINKLNKFINISFKKRRKIIEKSRKSKKFEEIKILDNISWKEVEIVEANKVYLPGIYLELSSQRFYPFSSNFSHLLGYLSKPSKKEIKLPFIKKMPTLEIGKIGLEKFYNEDLVGRHGKREIEVNSSGREIREISKEPSIKGKKINLSIDSRLQNFINSQLNNHKAGSIVVMDVNSGEVLAMASAPNYDPNKIISKPNNKYWESILDDKLSPLTNRSIQGLYSPGSTFKMIVAMAGLKNKLIDTNKNEFCEGKIEFGDRLYHCWKTKGHGKTNLDKAIKESCDVFFYELSKKVGINEISKLAKEFGLGERYNFGFENEKKGIVPSKEWKKENLKESWYAGETLIAAIGQGYILTTPLQLAVMTSRIASEGKKIEPSIIKNEKKEFKEIEMEKKYIKFVKKSMFKVVNESKGTANKSKSDLYKFSGKTGTSQVKKITIEEREREDFRKVEKEWKNKDHALFVGYMPSDKPKYAISVVIEHGGSGASVAAPIAKKTFDYIHELKL